MEIKQDSLVAACTAYSIASGALTVHVTAMIQALEAYDRIKSLRQPNEPEEEYSQRLLYTIKAFSSDIPCKESDNG